MALALALAGCTDDSDATLAPEPIEPMEPQAWRLDPDALLDVGLPISHIVVLHDGSTLDRNYVPAIVPLDSPRTVDAAEKIARSAMAELRAGIPFETVAARHSDDSGVNLDGNLGVVPGAELVPLYVDAFVQLRPEEYSPIIPSRHGFHIVRRNVVPEPTAAFADAIVVAYQDCATLPSTRESKRSLNEARALAKQVLAQLSAPGASFAELATRYSDMNNDGPQLGPFTPSSRGLPPTLAYRVLRAEIGEVIGPIETSAGIFLLKRTPATESAELAARWITVAHRLAFIQGNSLLTADEARAIAGKLHSQMDSTSADLARLSDSQCKESCSTRSLRWQRGQMPAHFEESVASVAFEQVAAVVETPEGLAVAVREAPGQQPRLRPELSLNVPHFEFRDPSWFINNLRTDQLVDVTRELAADILKDVTLSERARLIVQTSYRLAIENLSTSPQEGRLAIHQKLKHDIASGLSKDEHDRLTAYCATWARHKQVGQ